MAFFRQTGTLTAKNLKIVLIRHTFATVVRAFVLPIVLAAFLTFARNLFIPPADFGIGSPHPVRSLQDALSIAGGTGRNTVAFINSGHAGGDIDRVIDTLASTVTASGKNATRLSSVSDLDSVCKSTLVGVTPCYGAVIFNSSPKEGNGGIWNYTLRADGALGEKIDVTRSTNDGEVYILPFQRAIDSAITNLDSTAGGSKLPSTTEEYPFTAMTEAEREQQIREHYQSALINFLGVAFIAAMIGVTYHMTGFIATEREIGMAQLLDAMMPTKHRWQAQWARFLSYHITFAVVYLPGWVIAAAIIARGVFADSSAGIIIVFFILAGLALTSISLLGGAFFNRSQLSGVLSVIVYIVLAIIAQSLTQPKTAPVAVLSFFFAPCNFVYFITFVARWQRHSWPADLAHVAPESPWKIPGIALWVFLILQIFAYPIIAAYLDDKFHGTAIKGRTILSGWNDDSAPEAAVQLEGFTKVYSSSPIRRAFNFMLGRKEPVIAVDNLTLTAERGQILALLGANGSGKSTTLDSIAGIRAMSGGNITIDGTGGLGIAPQHNVLWDDLTVFEHIQIFNKLKSPNHIATKEAVADLVRAVDLGMKMKAMSRTLSGGQKRKLQLGMMLTGGSAVCCVDEVSSGIDPLSRRKVWDILLAERGKRTIILTTHFLDEADLLADKIAILSKGTLRAEGSSVELKDQLGSGYRIHVLNARDIKNPPEIEDVVRKVFFDVISYTANSSAAAARVIRALESAGIHDYKYLGPTIEDVFLRVAEEVQGEDFAQLKTDVPAVPATPGSEDTSAMGSEKLGLELLSGRPIGYWKQMVVLMWKRCIVTKNNWFPYAAAFVIPIVAAGLTSLYVKGQAQVGCTPADQNSGTDTSDYTNLYNDLYLVGGPSSKFDLTTMMTLFLPVLQGDFSSNGSSSGSSSNSTLSLLKSFHLVDTLDDFNNFVVQQRKNITPAGLWLGDASSDPTLAYVATYGTDVYTSSFGQNALDILLSNTSIAFTYAPFDIPWSPSTGKSLQLLVYMCLALAAYPAFFSLYPNIERRRNVRGLQYSNGVRSVPLWVSYMIFDFANVLISSAIVTILFAALSKVWYHVGYLFLIFMLYGLATTLLAYVISLFCKTQLSSYAFAAAAQVVGFLIYLIAYLCVYTYSAVNKVDSNLLLVHYIVSIFLPIGSVVRTLFIALNLFSTACTKDETFVPNPTAFDMYGAPIMYLIVQTLLLFGFLLWFDSGAGINVIRRLTQKNVDVDSDEHIEDEEVANELTRVTTSPHSQDTDGLRVIHLTKSFGRMTAVDNVTFGVKHGEVFALLGPNGAGKSTTISLIRGDIAPSRNGGDVLVENTSVSRRRAEARSHLGVCPQFDAIDSMTVVEHLRFYARIRGIPDVDHNVRAVLRAVGLEAFSTRMAHALSGGNKRKLSLGIALMGNPSVVLLDEPSSGLDAAAKRIMWRTLATIVPGRSILLTTHSMEEADALANRAGILAKRMLAMGTTDNLRQRFGDALHVHLIAKTAPHSTQVEMQRMKEWITQKYSEAAVEDQSFHGQVRFSVPAASVVGGEKADEHRSAVGQLIVDLEEQKEDLGIQHYSVSPTTLDQVFLAIVGRHNVQEEGQGEKDGEKKKGWWRK